MSVSFSLTSVNRSTLKGNNWLPMEVNHSCGSKPLSEGIGKQKSKQEVTKVVSLIKKVPANLL